MGDATTTAKQSVLDAIWHIGSAQSDLCMAQKAADTLATIVIDGTLTDGGALDSSTFSVFMLGIDAKIESALRDISMALDTLG